MIQGVDHHARPVLAVGLGVASLLVLLLLLVFRRAELALDTPALVLVEGTSIGKKPVKEEYLKK